MPKPETFEGPLKPGKRPNCPAAGVDVLSYLEKAFSPGKSYFDVVAGEIESGPFSILSERAKAQIRTWVKYAQEEAYERGLREGRKAKKQKK